MGFGKKDKEDKPEKKDKELKVPTGSPAGNLLDTAAKASPVLPPSRSTTLVNLEDDLKRKAEEEARKKAQAVEEEAKKKAQAAAAAAEEEAKKVADAAAAKKKEEEERVNTLKREAAKKAAQQQQEAAAAAAAAAATAPAEPSEEIEIQSLESVKFDNESKSTYRDAYDLFPPDVYTSYDKLQGFARDLNTQIPVIEIAVIGPRGSGKSAIIEALLGRVANVVATAAGPSTKRPIFFQLMNNVECDKPKITIKRDSSIREFDHDIEVTVEALSETIVARNKNFSEEPIFINFEHKQILNFTLIDTPGIAPADPSAAQIENIILNIARPAHRTILAVEATRDWNSMDVASFVKKVDPELSRSTFVYTKFFSQLQDFNNTRTINRFFAGVLPDVKTFFTTMPSHRVRAKFRDADKFQEKVYQAYRRDMSYLEQLQYDKRFERNIGVHALRRWMLNQVWKNYQESIPRILKHLRQKRQSTESRVKEVQTQIDELDSGKLRGIASNYVVNFLQIVEQLIAGTSEGHPNVNGQSLEEEKSAQAEGDWLDPYNRPIQVDAEEWGIPYHKSKLYGGQQFERLLSEFRSVSDHTEISEVTMDDIATAAGINKLNNIPNYAWAASDLAQQKTQDSLVPLIEQLCERAVYIMKRLTDVAERIADSRKKKWQSSYRGGTAENIEQYPYFTHHVKDLYYKFVDQTAKVCKEKCMDEFLNTKTIYWDLTEYPDHNNLPIDRASQEDTKTTVVQLSKTLFTTLRKRITKNVLLKFYNFFLVPIQTELWNEIQGKITCLSDQSLEQIFEISTTKEKLKDDERHLQHVLKRTMDQDQAFLDASTHFCHPIIINSNNSNE